MKMSMPRLHLATHPGVILLGIWLTISGLLQFFGAPGQGLLILFALLALAAGVLLMFDIRGVAVTSNLAMLLLAIWLVATAALELFPPLRFRHSAEILHVIGVAAGVAMILQVRSFTVFLLLLLLAVAAAALLVLN